MNNEITVTLNQPVLGAVQQMLWAMTFWDANLKADHVHWLTWMAVTKNEDYVDWVFRYVYSPPTKWGFAQELFDTGTPKGKLITFKP
jgi:hypothetical protein